jgi:hypothetical protein
MDPTALPPEKRPSRRIIITEKKRQLLEEQEHSEDAHPQPPKKKTKISKASQPVASSSTQATGPQQDKGQDSMLPAKETPAIPVANHDPEGNKEDDHHCSPGSTLSDGIDLTSAGSDSEDDDEAIEVDNEENEAERQLGTLSSNALADRNLIIT